MRLEAIAPLLNMLIAHIDGKRVPYSVRETTTYQADSHVVTWHRRTMLAAINQGLIRITHERPPHTVLTPKGRDVLAKALADYADALVRAGRGNGFLPMPEPRSIAIQPVMVRAKLIG